MRLFTSLVTDSGGYDGDDGGDGCAQTPDKDAVAPPHSYLATPGSIGADILLGIRGEHRRPRRGRRLKRIARGPFKAPAGIPAAVSSPASRPYLKN